MMPAKRVTVRVAAVASMLVGAALFPACTSDSAASHNTILVAPFSAPDSGGDPWSGVGLQHDLEEALGEVKQLTVIRMERESDARGILAERDSTRRAALIRDQAHKAGALYVLEGVVDRRDKNSQVRTSVRRVTDGSVRWAATYWLSPEELPAFAKGVARAVSDVIGSDSVRATGASKME
jgi:TolB-like protein